MTTQITYLSWPPLWVYWPIYLAMEKTQASLAPKVRFVRKEPHAVNDEAIRKQFSEAVRRQLEGKTRNFTMALCEPGISLDGSDRQLRTHRIRKLPLVWRQPHWVITDRKNIPELKDYLGLNDYKIVKFYEKPLDELLGKRGAKIYCYPPDTTSGDYVRTYFQKIARTRGGRALRLREVGIDENAVLDRKNSYVVSFSPWHQFDMRRAAIHELPGATKDITALLIPDLDTGHPGLDAKDLYQLISVNLKQTLASLDDTQGDESQVEAYIRKYHGRVCDFLGVKEGWMTTDKLTKFLTEYVKRGCYFPYQVIEDAFGSELSYLLEDEAEHYKDQLVKGTREGLSRLFGFKQDWSDLSFAERLSAHLRWGPKSPDEPDGDPRTLSGYLSHLPQEGSTKGFSRRSAFGMIKVQTDEAGDAVPLIRFNGMDRNFFCADGTAHAGGARSQIFGSCSLTGGTFTAQQVKDCKNEPFNPCLACVSGGLPGAVLRGGAKKLAEEMLARYPPPAGHPHDLLAEYRAALAGADGSHKFNTLLCWWDVERLFGIFCEEMRRPHFNEQHAPCLVVMVGDEQFELPGEHQVLLAIFWRGDTNEEGRTGAGARGNLNSWARAQKNAGRRVRFVRLWFASKDGIQDDTSDTVYPYHGNKTSEADPFLVTGVKQLWETARDMAREGGYTFAYVTAFDYPPAPQETQ